MAWITSARPRTAALAVAAGLLLATGCTGSDDAATSPTTAATATASPTAEATDSPTTETPEPTDTSALPPLPDAATENTPEGAEAFIRYYFDVVNMLHRQPQTGVLEDLTDPECQSCTNAEERISHLVEEEAHLSGDLYSVGEMTRIGGGAPDVTRFNVDWRGPGATVVGSNGEVLDEIEPADFTGVMAAKWTGDGWVFYDSAVSG
jgi:hypothetical protein